LFKPLIFQDVKIIEGFDLGFETPLKAEPLSLYSPAFLPLVGWSL